MNNEKTILPEVWVTRYALTKGILKFTQAIDHGNGMMTPNKSNQYFLGGFHGEGKDWHRTEAGAQKKAQEMRNKRILDLKRQYEALLDQYGKAIEIEEIPNRQD